MRALPLCRFALGQLECLVGPLKRGDPILTRAYSELFGKILSLDMPEQVYLEAAQIRARFSLRTPDALHLATAQHHRCDSLWTNDDRLIQASHGLSQNILGATALP